MNHLAMLGWAELVLLAVLITIAVGCWLVFSRSSNENKDE
jgi:hypothetical protein